ncbi:zinc ribbon domain-containing protein [Acidianus sp. HS-5]|uniref:zinc ribbon domain-containing protein n=1 Tax=Acidianus sp. HS-5 TaxID=2886040 RepID=UPI001F1D16CA|nr:zinc ribbon domain-containing protein [Acidianus sp. HS-5]BDC17927.1 hypothetical protein HS5_08170 [Acidianus sp. HS-5]
MVKYCPRCGYPNVDDAKFCMKCGYQLPQYIPQSPPPTLPSTQQPNFPPPSQPSASQQPSTPKKRAPVLAIIGVVMVVVVVLAVFLVFLPLFSFHGITALASTASKEFGGKWVTVKCKSATATYVGKGVYEVKYFNGTTVYENYDEIKFCCFNNVLSGLSSVSANSYFQINYYNVYPAKVVFTLVNGTVNGEKTYILAAGAYYNITPNPASEGYSSINSVLSNASYSSYISEYEAYLKSQGICVTISTYNGLDYLYMSVSNYTMLSETQAPSSLGGYSIHSLSEFGGVSNNEEIVVITINLVPTLSQMETMVSQVQGCL